MMRSARRLLIAAALTTVAGLVGCVSPFDGACTDELGWELTPRSRTLAVGETLSPRGTIVTCGGRDREAAELVLVVADSGIVTVGANARSVTAVGVGTVQVLATDRRYGPLGYITITVVPP